MGACSIAALYHFSYSISVIVMLQYCFNMVFVNELSVFWRFLIWYWIFNNNNNNNSNFNNNNNTV